MSLRRREANRRIFPREVTQTTSTASTTSTSTIMNTGVETTSESEEIEMTTSSTSTMSTEMNLELSATTGLVGITLGEVSTVSTSTATVSTTSDSSIPDGPSTTTTEPVFTTTTKSSTTTTTLEDNVTTTTTTPPPTVAQDATTTEKESTSDSNETTQGNEVTVGEENTAPTTTENDDVSEPVTEPFTVSTSATNNGGNDSDIDDEPEHPTIGWPSKNQNVQVKKIVREFVKILSEFRGKLDDDFIDRWTGQNGGIGKFQNNADRIMRSITSSDRECIDLDTKIPNPFKQESGFKIFTQPTFGPGPGSMKNSTIEFSFKF